MHYVPESATEFLADGNAQSSRDGVDVSFHYRSAPIYLLTAVVGALLVGDFVLGFTEVSGWSGARSPLGFRLALLAAVLGGARIFYQTVDGLLDGRIGADLALTLAAMAAITLGEYETAGLVVFIALCGESLEGYTVDRARRAIGRVFNLWPAMAHVVRDATEVDVPVRDVVVGDTVVIRPGERIPVDGVVTGGTSAVDQSPLTGESLPVDKAANDHVFSGTLNQFGAMTVHATQVGEHTTLGQVVQLVSSAAEHKAPIERTADRLARLFLPMVLGAAVLTLVGWRIQSGMWSAGFRPALGVLVVACPCPLLLATPTAVMAAMSWLARRGVVVKGSVALERLALVDSIAFDKTGTLTRGELAIGDVLAIGPLDEADVLHVAAMAERRSEHLLARVIVRAAEAHGAIVPGLDNFTAHPGSGIVATARATQLGVWADHLVRHDDNRLPDENTPPEDSSLMNSNGSSNGDAAADVDASRAAHRIVVGNQRLMEANGIAISTEVDRAVRELDAAGQTALLVSVDDGIVGLIGIRDTVRSESRAVIEQLRSDGVTEFALLTGDRLAAARHVADELPLLQSVRANMLPADKAEWIRSRIAAGRHVAMIGDGVNDAPALASATVGLALGGVGSNITAEAGDVVLMGDPLTPLPGLVRLSRALVTNVRQSIYLFAFGMNALGVLLCAGGLLSPVAGAIFHEFSSLAVMLNALRLLWFESWNETPSGSTVQRLSAGVERITLALSPTRLVFGLIRQRHLIARLAATGVAIFWLTIGLIQIPPDEQAVVTRFGRFEVLLDSGTCWRWPPPFERIRRERVDALRAVSIGFRSEAQPAGIDGTVVDGAAAFDADDSLRSMLFGRLLSAFTDGDPNPSGAGTVYRSATSPIEWTSEHRGDAYEVIPDESLVLTADEVPVEITAELHYRITDLRQFAFAISQPDSSIRSVAESCLRTIASQTSLEGMLTSDRADVERRSRDMIAARLTTYELGIEVVDFSVMDVHPPRWVVPAYRDVADALEERERSINEAQAYAASKLLDVAGEDAVLLLSGKAPSDDAALDVGATFHADWKPDDATWTRLLQDDSGNGMLAGAAASEILAAGQDAVDRVETARGAADRLNSLQSVWAAHPELTATQLYWKTISATLATRPLTIIDPTAAGRQHFMLVDPARLGNTIDNRPGRFDREQPDGEQSDREPFENQ